MRWIGGRGEVGKRRGDKHDGKGGKTTQKDTQAPRGGLTKSNIEK